MIKIITNILFLLIFSLSILLAQEKVDKEAAKENLDARKVLMKQVDEAKQKDIANNAVVKPGSNLVKQDDVSNNIGWLRILFFVIEGALLIGLFYLWNRSRINKIIRKKNRFKEQIQKIRQEKVGSPPSNYLSQIRKGLSFLPTSLENSGKEITLKAKKYSLSKGELHLAAKLKLLMGGHK